MNTQEKLWKMGILVGALLVVFLFAMSIKTFKSISTVGKSDQMTNMISVEGTGEVVAIPDIATFSFSVTETDMAVAVAQSKATEKINSALKAVREAGIEDKDIKTTSYNINPHYEYKSGVCTATYCNPGKSVLTGYDVSQTIEIKVRKLDKAGDLLSKIGTLGVQNVNSLNFSVDDMDTVKAEARAKAINAAKAKATSIAKSLGVTLVGVTSFYETQPYSYYASGKGGVAMASSLERDVVAPEVPTGEQKITSTVTISYEIR